MRGGGGYNQINPDNPTEWFTANTDVSIERCALGVDCRAQDFSSGLVVSNATVGGDSGPFFTPFILDPQNSGGLLVGTCRVWRGATDGSGFSALTNNLETGGSESCTGSEVNLVRALAAGGIKDTAGFSNVMYAGTDGLGPLISTGGHIWVATNVSARRGRVDRPHRNNQPFRIPDLGGRYRPIRYHRPDRLHDDHGISRLAHLEDNGCWRILDRLQRKLARRARQRSAGGRARKHGLCRHRCRSLREQHGQPGLDRGWAGAGERASRILAQRRRHRVAHVQFRGNQKTARFHLRPRDMGVHSGLRAGFHIRLPRQRVDRFRWAERQVRCHPAGRERLRQHRESDLHSPGYLTAAVLYGDCPHGDTKQFRRSLQRDRRRSRGRLLVQRSWRGQRCKYHHP